MTRDRVALMVALVAAAAIAGAWAFQLAGYAPCELCLKQRVPYYIGIPLALVAFAAARRGARPLASGALALAALAFAASAALGAYHAGVEWKWWPGPSDCTGAYQAAGSTADFLKQLQNVAVVRCDEVALRVLGLSLAAWNVLISIALAALAAWGVTRPRAAPAA